MAYRRIELTIDGLFVLKQYPQKTCQQIGLELGLHAKTVARKLRECGIEVKRGRREKVQGAEEQPCAK